MDGGSRPLSALREITRVAPPKECEGRLLTFFDFPAEHWLHLRTGNAIESPFATVRLRQRVTKGADSRQKGLLMAFQLLAMAERRWRRINAPQLVPLVRAGGCTSATASLWRGPGPGARPEPASGRLGTF